MPLSSVMYDMDYNGEYLAVTGFVPVGGGSLLDSCDVYLSLYGKEGLAYYGVYESSLTSGLYGDSYEYRCSPDLVDPLTISWN